MSTVPARATKTIEFLSQFPTEDGEAVAARGEREPGARRRYARRVLVGQPNIPDDVLHHWPVVRSEPELRSRPVQLHAERESVRSRRLQSAPELRHHGAGLRWPAAGLRVSAESS